MSGYIYSDGSALIGGINPTGVGQALLVDEAGNLKVVTASSQIINMARAVVVVLNQTLVVQTASGNSQDLSVGSYAELTVDCNITAVAGTDPTIQFCLDRKGADGVYYPIWQSITCSGIGQISTSIGAGMSIAQGFGSTVRLRWVIGGSGASFTFSSSIIGK